MQNKLNMNILIPQIFELEKRFLYQKYLSPADRDEIAAQLGLSNAQVRRKIFPYITFLYFDVLHLVFCNLTFQIWYYEILSLAFIKIPAQVK